MELYLQINYPTYFKDIVLGDDNITTVLLLNQFS